jgi:hypothetical protein
VAEYGSNKLAVRLFRTEIPEGQTEKVLTELPPGTPMVGGLHPGGKDTPLPGRRRAGPKDLPWKSWLQNKRQGVKSRKKKRNRFASQMG